MGNEVKLMEAVRQTGKERQTQTQRQSGILSFLQPRLVARATGWPGSMLEYGRKNKQRKK